MLIGKHGCTSRRRIRGGSDETKSYFVVGLIDYIETNRIECSTSYQCRDFQPESVDFQKNEKE